MCTNEIRAFTLTWLLGWVQAGHLTIFCPTRQAKLRWFAHHCVASAVCLPECEPRDFYSTGPKKARTVHAHTQIDIWYTMTQRERYIYTYYLSVCVHPLSFICLEEPCTVNYSKSWLMATHTMARLAKASRWHPCQLSPLAAAVFECQSGGRAGC